MRAPSFCPASSFPLFIGPAPVAPITSIDHLSQAPNPIQTFSSLRPEQGLFDPHTPPLRYPPPGHRVRAPATTDICPSSPQSLSGSPHPHPHRPPSAPTCKRCSSPAPQAQPSEEVLSGSLVVAVVS